MKANNPSLNGDNPNSKVISKLIVEAIFRFQTLEESSALAEFISGLCPHKTLIQVGLTEIFTNAIEHGNLNISADEKIMLQKENRWLEEIERRLSLPENQNKWVQVFLDKHEEEYHITVIDEGDGFDWQHAEQKAHAQAKAEAKNLSTQGRGILMAENLGFKRLQYSGKGNVVTCIINL